MSTTLVSKNCQTSYFDKEVLHDNKCLGHHKLLVTVFVYSYCRFQIQHVYLFRSQANGNCLLFTFSIAMRGYNRYVDDLKILTVVEL